MTGQDLVNVIAVAGFSLAVLSLWLTRRDSKWKRRHAVMEGLRNALTDLEGPVVAAQDAQQVRTLYSVTTGAHLSDLEAAIGKVPDWRFQRWLRSFVDAIRAVRGAQQPNNPKGSPAAMTPAQMRKLEAARSNLEKMLKQLDRAVRKGSA